MSSRLKGESELLPGLVVLKAGVQSMIQDLGRFGHARQGLSQGGAMDLHAYCWANKLLGNSMWSPTLELVIGMAEFRAECDLCLALTGADMRPAIDGEPIQHWSAFSMKRGQVLTLNAAVTGMRGYLAVAGGGFQVSPVLGSVSTVVRNGMGDLLVVGDVVPAVAVANREVVMGSVPYRYRPSYDETITLRVIESYQAERFAADAKALFYRSLYTLTTDADRMGARLDGPAISHSMSGLISEGITMGAIQVPAGGQPIILLNDRQTLGGYPKIGCVARVDLPKLAQARPGTCIQFVPVSLEESRAEWVDFCRFFDVK